MSAAHPAESSAAAPQHPALIPTYSDTGTGLISKATALMLRVHRNHYRKFSDEQTFRVPYVTHLLGTASIVGESPSAGAEHVAAALLHDSVEDRPVELFGHEPDWSGGKKGIQEQLAARLMQEFGDTAIAHRVATLVMSATEDRAAHHGERLEGAAKRADWLERKRRYRETLAAEPLDLALVSLADNVHNLRSLVSDLVEHGPKVWDRFNADATDRLDHMEQLCAIARERFGEDVLTQHLDHDFERLKAIVAIHESEAAR